MTHDQDHDHDHPESIDRSIDNPRAQPIFSAFPTETIFNVLHFLDPQDLIRLQFVSKLFYPLIYDPTLWRTVYTNARTHLPLPPGPYPWQSTRFLQRALVYSARLARTWTTAPLAVRSSASYVVPRQRLRSTGSVSDTESGTSYDHDRRVHWVPGGRWVLTARSRSMPRAGDTTSSTEFWVHDIETGRDRLLWEDRDSGRKLANWSATSLILPQAHLVYIVIHLGLGKLEDPVKLLEFVADDDAGHLLGPMDTLDVPTWCLPREAFIPHLRIKSTSGCGSNGKAACSYAYISLSSVGKPRHSLLFDACTRRFYKFPRFRTQLDLLSNYPGKWLPHLVEVYFTPTHVFVLNRTYLIHGNIGPLEIIQTFSIPNPDIDRPERGRDHERNHDHDSNLGLPCASTSTGTDTDTTAVVSELRLTHEMLTRNTMGGSLWLVPVYSWSNALTGTTTLRFLHTVVGHRESRAGTTTGSGDEDGDEDEVLVWFECTDYVLLAEEDDGRDDTDKEDNDHPDLNTIVRSAKRVLPIDVVSPSHKLFIVHGTWQGNVVDVSPDGIVRGICRIGLWKGDGGRGTLEMREIAHKFTVDASAPTSVTAVVGNASEGWGVMHALTHDEAEVWDVMPSLTHGEHAMDGVRGRTWYVASSPGGSNMDSDSEGRRSVSEQDMRAVVVEFE